MDELQRKYLEDTHDILIDYDGYRKASSLMDLIDETRERIANVLNNEIPRVAKHDKR